VIYSRTWCGGMVSSIWRMDYTERFAQHCKVALRCTPA
jgi:hypothetical protein